MSAYADVLLPLPVDRPFTYGVPPELRGRIRVGQQVEVPFRSKILSGIVQSLPAAPPSFVVRDVRLIERDEPLVGPAQIDLARWMADAWLCGWGEALSAMVPSGVRRGTAARTIPVAVLLPEPGGPPPRSEPARRALALLESAGGRLEVRLLAERAKVGRGVVAGLARKRRLEIVQEQPAAEAGGGYGSTVEEHPPTPAQRAAARVIADARRGPPRGVLLHGVTGSGKTEVYLQAIRDAVAAGRQAIVLVPEVALTPQTTARFKARFPRTAVLHASLTPGERADAWRAVRAGEVDVVVGARSAVFAPVPALGLVVLDEEHEPAYKQEIDPRYHARDVAMKRAEAEGAAVVLGSATPSLESLHAARTGRLRLAELPERIGGRPLPPVEVIDMLGERRDVKRYPLLSRVLVKAVKEAAARKEQSLLFLNQRGYTRLTRCRSCGWTLRCTKCDLALAFHKTESAAECHACGRAFPKPAACPACGAGSLWDYGAGTERIEEELRKVFPGLSVARMDSDAMRTREDYARAIRGLWEGSTDLLVGTQMIAKGFDVPNVTVIGVVNADTGFFVHDFRAAERTFQLVTQVAGRAGRGPKGGRVIVQTFNPRHYAITCAAAHDGAGFAEKELAFRREEGYPPYSRLVRILLAASKPALVDREAVRLGERLLAEIPPMLAQVLGPAELPRIRGRHRRHFLVKAQDLEAVRGALRRILPSLARNRALQVSVDVDPVDLG